MGWGSMLAGRAIAGRQMKKHRRKTDEMARKRASEREWARRDRELAKEQIAQRRLNELDRERRRAEKEARANAMPVIDDSFRVMATEKTETRTVLLLLLVGSLVVGASVALIKFAASEPNSALAILVIGVVVFVFYPRKKGDRNEAE